MKARQARIVLTGASGGIGRAAAAAFVAAGASVLLVGRSPARLAAQAAELVQRPGVASSRVHWQVADLSGPDGIAAVSQAASAWDANVLVHAAGLPSFGAFESLAARDLQAVLQTNLLAPMLLTQALLAPLGRQGAAQVIFVGSALGSIGLPGFSAYAASKFGLRGFAEALRRELADGPVRVQYLAPRSTRTAFNDAGVEAYNRATGTAMDHPERVAAELLRLLQDEAAERFIGYPEKLAVRLNALLPALFDRVFTKHRRSLPPASVPVAVAVSGLAGAPASVAVPAPDSGA